MSALRRTALLSTIAALAVTTGCAICDPIFKDPTLGPVLAPLKQTSDDTKAKADNVTTASKKAIEGISPQDERAVGQAGSLEVIAAGGETHGLILERKLVDYVNEVGNLVAQQGRRMPMSEKGKPRTLARRFFFGVINDDSWNAFSLPGGYIYVTRGLLENITSESDLAFVLGHEIVHVDREHNLAAMKAQIGGGATAAAFLKETNLLGTNEKGEVSFNSEKFFGFVVGKLADIKLKVGLDKDQEREADKIGLQYAIAAGYDAHGAERVLNLLALNPGAVRTVFRQHDTAEQRLALIADDIAKAKPGAVGMKRYEEVGFKSLAIAVADRTAPAATPITTPAAVATPAVTAPPAATPVPAATAIATPAEAASPVPAASP